jgi:predicted Holliday junction resolvase-like endonuclease
MNKMLAMIVFLVFGLLIYLGFVIDTYKPVVEQNQPGILPKKEVVNDDYELPELSEEELAVSDSLHKSYVKEAEQESESKSVEDMIKRVDDILTGKVQQDTISFNYTTKGIEIINPYTK